MRRSHAATAVASLVNERDWQRQVTELAELLGYQWAHFRSAQTSKGWRTPVSGSLGAGFPDLILARAGRLLYVECKRQDGRLTLEQQAVHEALRVAGGEVHTWRPADLPLVAEVLR